MNPVSSSAGPGRSEPTRDAGAVPTDVASLFAAIFASTAAATAAAASVPLPEPVALPVATSCAAGEIPQAPPGGWPGGTSSGLPAFPALVAQGRPRLELPASAGALADLAPARRDPGEHATSAVKAGVAQSKTQPVTGEASPPIAVAAETLAQLHAAQAAKPKPLTASGKPVVGAAEGTPLLAKLAIDGGEPVKVTPTNAAGNAGQNTAQAGRGKGRASAQTSEADAAATAYASAATATPTLPIAAQGTGVTPHIPLADTPLHAAGAAAAPVQVPDEKPQLASPSHATVAFDSGDGQEGRLRVSLRGNMLSATIQMPDAAAAQRLEQDAGGITRALRAQGFEDARLVIDAPRAAGSGQRSGDDTSPREHKHPREGQPQSGERNARRERGTSRNER